MTLIKKPESRLYIHVLNKTSTKQ